MTSRGTTPPEWTVPGYRVTRMLGFGAAGEVWEGIDGGSGERVALKRLRTDRPDADREQLRREAALLAAFRHPGVVGLRAVLALDVDLVLVLDLAEGGSLAQVLGRVDRLRSGELVGVVAPVADALAAAHREGLLHGDVSPGNVLLAADGSPLLADLGTARLAGDEAAPVRATSRYLDPVVRAGGPLTAASDVYALAAVAAHALTARPVRAASGGPQEWADHAYTLGVPAQLAAALCAGLAVDPARRPDAEEFGASLRACCEPASLARLLPPDGVAGPAEPAVLTGGPPDEDDPGVDPDMLTNRVAGAEPADAPAPSRRRRWWPHRDTADPEPAEDRLVGWPEAVVRATPVREARADTRAAPAAPPPPTARTGARAAPTPRAARTTLVARGPWGRPGGPAARAPGLVTRVAATAVLVAAAAAGGIRWAAVDRDAGTPAGGAVPVAGRPSSSAMPPDRAAPASPVTTPTAGPVAAPGAVSARPSGPAEQRWRATLDTLDGHRAAAFARAQAALLALVYTPGSPALRADTEAVRALVAAGATATGVRHELRTVRVVSTEVDRVRLAVTDRMAGYRIVDRHGVVLRVAPARGDAAFVVDLRRTVDGWRIAAVTR